MKILRPIGEVVGRNSVASQGDEIVYSGGVFYPGCLLTADDLDSLIPDFSKGVPCPVLGEGLLPAISQDHASGKVLMMAWMNLAAWNETLQSGRAVYFSRSRGKLWRKGESSGHAQIVKEIRLDCDADVILLLVEQTGAACHEGFQSCFFRAVDRHGVVTVRETRLVDPKTVYGTS